MCSFKCVVFGVIWINQLLPVTNFKEDQSHWRKLGEQELNAALNKKVIEGEAKNVILFVADGMGITTSTSARIYGKGESGYLAWEKFNNIGVIKTYSANKLVPDSCSTATALFCGVKANHKTSGVDATVDVNDCETSLKAESHLESIFNWAQNAGKSTGFVTTTRVTHATPSALYAHTPNRNWESGEDTPGKNIKVIMGGGRQCLQSSVVGTDADPIDTWSCYSRDGRDLIEDWKKDKASNGFSYQVLGTNEELQNVDLDKEFTLGVFANGHLKYDYERDRGPKGMPSLSNMTEKAIQLLQKSEKGYILMIEGGMIDQAHHRGHAKKALDETIAFSEAIEIALNMTDPKETLIIVTSDHSHSMVLTGYPDRGTGVLSHTDSAIDKVPYTSLLYGTGGPNNYQFFQSAVLTDEVTHSGTDVLVFAKGPMAHLFTTVHEQTYVAYVISYASKIGPYAKNSNEPASIHVSCISFSVLVIFLSLNM
ncbi:hypothetical protein JTB14_030641 [Gonioctena quinquepunctata]|nr:hypothetical protein JTB14_030641 [Gonioctena quinquepunctata]